MSDAAPSAPAKPKKGNQPKKLSEHPKYIEMIIEAITSLADRKGSSRQAITKYIKANHKVGDGADVHIKLALKRGVSSGKLTQIKGVGASGSFKVVKQAPEKPKQPAKKPAVRKQAKKPTSKKSVKKTAAKKKTETKKKSEKGKKKSEKKSTKKSPVKKTAKKNPKSPTRKPAAKKVTKKQAGKKTTKTAAKKSGSKKSGKK